MSDSVSVIDPLIDHFPTPFDHNNERDPMSLLEQSMKKLSASIRRKPDWRTKRLDCYIVDKWRAEAAHADPLLTKEALDYVMQELEYYDQTFDEATGIEMSTVDGVYQSDSLASKPLFDQLTQTVDSLFGSQSDDEKDWHPGSTRQVWDIVHPSLYCAVAGRTRVVDHPIPLEQALALQGTGEPITPVEFRRRLFQAIGPYVEWDSRYHRRYVDVNAPDIEANVIDSVDLEAQERMEAATAHAQGKITLTIVCSSHAKPGAHPLTERHIKLFVRPDVSLAFIKGEVTRKWPVQLLGNHDFTLYRDASRAEFTANDDTKSLVDLAIHSLSPKLLAMSIHNVDAASAPEKLVINVLDRRSNVISVHHFDANDRILLLKQQLCKNEGIKVFWPSVTRNVQPDDQQLVLTNRTLGDMKVLDSNKTFADYGLRNFGEKDVSSYRWPFCSIMFQRLNAETTDKLVEVIVQPLAHPHILMDINFTTTVIELKRRMCYCLPGVEYGEPLRLAEISFFFPANSSEALNDDVVLISLGVHQSDVIGVRWTGDDNLEKDSQNLDSKVADFKGQDLVSESDDSDYKPPNTETAKLSQAMDNHSVGGDSQFTDKKEELLNVEIMMNPTHKPLAALVSPSLTVGALKDRIRTGKYTESNSRSMIAVGSGVSIVQQHLTTGFPRDLKVMYDHQTLEFYGLTNQRSSSMLHLNWRKLSEAELLAAENIPRASFQVSIVFMHSGQTDPDSLSTRQAVDVTPRTTIGGLKHIVHSSTGYKIEQIRVRRPDSGTFMDDALTVAEASLVDGCSVVADIANIHVKVMLLTGQQDRPTVAFTLHCDTQTTFGMIKQSIAARPDGYAAEMQWIDAATQKGNLFPLIDVADSQSLGLCGLRFQYDVLYVLVSKRTHPQASQHSTAELAVEDDCIRLKCMINSTNDVLAISMRREASLYALKWRLASMGIDEISSIVIRSNIPGQLSHPFQDQYVSLSSLNLMTGDEMIVDKSDIRLLVTLPRGIPSQKEPFARSHSECVVHAQIDDTIQTVKQSIARITGVVAELQHLRLSVRDPVDDQRTFSSYNFKKRAYDDDAMNKRSYQLSAEVQAELIVLTAPDYQPPRIDRKSQFVSIKCRFVAFSGKVFEMFATRTETVSHFKQYIIKIFHAQLQRMSPQYWSDDSIGLFVSGRLITNQQTMEDCFDLYAASNCPIDMIIVSSPPVEDQDSDSGIEEPEDNLSTGSDLLVDDHKTNDIGNSLVSTEAEGQHGSEPFDLTAVSTHLHRHPLTLSEKSGWLCDMCARPGVSASWCCSQGCSFDMCPLCWRRSMNDTHEENESDESDDDQTALELTSINQPLVEHVKQSIDHSLNPKWQKDRNTSSQYAWLPSQFAIDDDGSASIQSYINNLHPETHQALYPIIEQLMTRFVPMFERVLTDLRHPRGRRFPVGSWYDEHEEQMRWNANREATEEEEDIDYEDDRTIYQPDVVPYDPPRSLSSKVSLRGRTLQVITKLANIILTPESPNYAGGVWHVEGMRNESIVASGIAYYDQQNIGPSKLKFRINVDEPKYEQYDHEGVETIFGLTADAPLVQSLQHVDTCNGRCIAFPNIYQHQVSPFSLIDPTKPGHRSILVFFLVDPTIQVLSTAHVPPQQLDWYTPTLNHSLLDAFDGADVLKNVVESLIDWPMSLEETKQHREKLMAERKFFVREHSETVYERPFNLCEH